MPVFNRGKIKFETTKVKNEDGRMVAMFELSCLPPPTGSETHFNYSAKALPVFIQRYLQPQEMPAMLAGAKLDTETALTEKTLADDLAKAFSFNAVDIDITNVPAEWSQNVDCYKVTVGYIVSYDVYEIKATSTEDFKTGFVEYPKDDTVATFRIAVPARYYFARYFTWNPECCPGKTAVSRPMETNGLYPEIKLKLGPGFGLDSGYRFTNPYSPNYTHDPEKDKDEKEKKEKKDR
jgi:hypothetical protein